MYVCVCIYIHIYIYIYVHYLLRYVYMHIEFVWWINRRVPFKYMIEQPVSRQDSPIFTNESYPTESYPMTKSQKSFSRPKSAPHHLPPVLVWDHSKVHDCTTADPNSPRNQHQPPSTNTNHRPSQRCPTQESPSFSPTIRSISVLFIVSGVATPATRPFRARSLCKAPRVDTAPMSPRHMLPPCCLRPAPHSSERRWSGHPSRRRCRLRLHASSRLLMWLSLA